jgi:hypothetical protein
MRVIAEEMELAVRELGENKLEVEMDTLTVLPRVLEREVSPFSCHDKATKQFAWDSSGFDGKTKIGLCKLVRLYHRAPGTSLLFSRPSFCC